MKRAARLFFMLAVSAASLVGAQDNTSPVSTGSLTLEQAQKEALQNSPDYRAAQDVEKEAGWEQLEAVSKGFLPSVTVSGKQFFATQYAQEGVNFLGPNQYSPFPENFPNTTLALDANFDLFDGFQNIHQLDAANNGHEAKKVLSDYALIHLQEDVRFKFYASLASQLLSDMADENVKTLESHLNIVEDQLANGQATKYDQLRVDVQLSEAKSEAVSYHDNVALAREALARSMGLKDDSRTLTGEMPVLDLDAVMQDVAAIDITQSPQLRAKQLQSLAAADQSAAAGAALWVPRISLIGEYQWYNSQDYNFSANQIINTGDYLNSYFFGASATWSILDGGESVAKANEADERAKQAKDDYTAARLQTPYDFDYWKRRLASSVALYKTQLKNVDEAKESARLATVGFKAGTRTTTDVLDAEVEEYRASAELVQAQLGALEALINLELLTGKRLSHD
jgi:outer membrane protein TolC